MSENPMPRDDLVIKGAISPSKKHKNYVPPLIIRVSGPSDEEAALKSQSTALEGNNSSNCPCLLTYKEPSKKVQPVALEAANPSKPPYFANVQGSSSQSQPGALGAINKNNLPCSTNVHLTNGEIQPGALGATDQKPYPCLTKFKEKYSQHRLFTQHKQTNPFPEYQYSVLRSCSLIKTVPRNFNKSESKYSEFDKQLNSTYSRPSFPTAPRKIVKTRLPKNKSFKKQARGNTASRVNKQAATNSQRRSGKQTNRLLFRRILPVTTEKIISRTVHKVQPEKDNCLNNPPYSVILQGSSNQYSVLRPCCLPKTVPRYSNKSESKANELNKQLNPTFSRPSFPTAAWKIVKARLPRNKSFEKQSLGNNKINVQRRYGKQKNRTYFRPILPVTTKKIINRAVHKSQPGALEANNSNRSSCLVIVQESGKTSQPAASGVIIIQEQKNPPCLIVRAANDNSQCVVLEAINKKSSSCLVILEGSSNTSQPGASGAIIIEEQTNQLSGYKYSALRSDSLPLTGLSNSSKSELKASQIDKQLNPTSSRLSVPTAAVKNIKAHLPENKSFKNQSHNNTALTANNQAATNTQWKSGKQKNRTYFRPILPVTTEKIIKPCSSERLKKQFNYNTVSRSKKQATTSTQTEFDHQPNPTTARPSTPEEIVKDFLSEGGNFKGPKQSDIPAVTATKQASTSKQSVVSESKGFEACKQQNSNILDESKQKQTVPRCEQFGLVTTIVNEKDDLNYLESGDQNFQSDGKPKESNSQKQQQLKKDVQQIPEDTIINGIYITKTCVSKYPQNSTTVFMGRIPKSHPSSMKKNSTDMVNITEVPIISRSDDELSNSNKSESKASQFDKQLNPTSSRLSSLPMAALTNVKAHLPCPSTNQLEKEVPKIMDLPWKTLSENTNKSVFAVSTTCKKGETSEECLQFEIIHQTMYVPKVRANVYNPAEHSSDEEQGFAHLASTSNGQRGLSNISHPDRSILQFFPDNGPVEFATLYAYNPFETFPIKKAFSSVENDHTYCFNPHWSYIKNLETKKFEATEKKETSQALEAYRDEAGPSPYCKNCLFENTQKDVDEKSSKGKAKRSKDKSSVAGVDVFGNSYSAKDLQKFLTDCPNCCKKVPAPRFVKHLQYCMKIQKRSVTKQQNEP